jgi:hypothetical protein
MVDLFVGLMLGNMVAGVIGNRTDALFCQCWQTIYERLRQGGRPVNHDLQRTIRKAILQATLCLLSDALRERGVDVQNLISRFWRRLPFGQPRGEESRWLWRVYNELTAELGRVSDAEYVPLSSVAESQLASLLQPQGVTAEERAKELQERLTDEWLGELRKRFGEPPEVFVKRLREGWQPPKENKQVFWFDLVCAFFAHEVKHNQVVANIVMAKLLAGLTLDEQPLSDALTAYLERRFAPILQRLDDIKQQLDELGRQQREGFEELKERQAEIIATLMPMRETQQVMQALLSEVVKSITPSPPPTVPLKRARAIAFQLSWLMTLLRIGQARHPAAVEAQIESYSAELELQLPPNWREDVMADDWEIFMDLLAGIGGQLVARKPQLVPYFEAGFNLPVAAARGELAKLEAITAELDLPDELRKPDPYNILAWLNRVHDHYESVLREPK